MVVLLSSYYIYITYTYTYTYARNISLKHLKHLKHIVFNYLLTIPYPLIVPCDIVVVRGYNQQ